MAVAPPFNLEEWLQRFPQLAALPGAGASVLNALYAEAQLLPEGNRIVNDANLSAQQVGALLNLAVAHMVALQQQATSPGGSVGRIASATEGSTSVVLDYPTRSSAEAWWAQTQFGAQFWRSLGPYRTAQYIPGPGLGLPPTGVVFGPVYGGFGWGGWR